MEKIQNNFESKISCKIESNSRGFNTTVHVYQGVSQKDMDETIANTVYAHIQLQGVLKEATSKLVDIEK